MHIRLYDVHVTVWVDLCVKELPCHFQPLSETHGSYKAVTVENRRRSPYCAVLDRIPSIP